MEILSIIVPVFNEEQQLESVIRNLLKTPCPIQREWIFVDDCSQDRSPEILDSLSKELDFRYFRQRRNLGKGAAVIRGFKEAKGTICLIQDADFEYDPEDIPSLLQPLLDGRADVVYGSRFKKSSHQVHRTYHYFVNRFLTVLSNLFSGIYLTDMETCYKVFRSDLIQSMKLQSRRFGIEVEMTAYLGKIRARIHELPISYYPRTKLQGKKINWKDGIAAFWHLIRFNFFVSADEAFHQLPEKYLPSAKCHK